MSSDFSQFTIDQCLDESASFFIYYGHGENRKSAILKVSKEHGSSGGSSNNLDREYEIGRHLNTEGALKVYGKGVYQDKQAIIMEGFIGIPLSKLLTKGLDIGTFLDLSLKTAKALDEVHVQNVTHLDLKPSNIIFNQNEDKIKITDFGISNIILSDELIYANPLLIEGSFPYMSPEQTGRINHPIDFRSDLYSLGITFYQMITGMLPFKGNDILEWVHCHIAQMAQPPHEVRPEIPQVVSQIIMKLISKMPDDRYQTSQGLVVDLEECLEQWKKKGEIKKFEIAAKDRPYRFQIPHKLYGRHEDQQLLYTIFQRMLAQGVPEYVLISGYSGIGKTSLVQELYRPLVQNRGFFASGKFDQLKRHIPYYALSQALKEIIQQILIQDESAMRDWREKFNEVLSPHGKLITDLVPDLELIIGPQPDVQSLGPAESLNRFNLTLQNFIRALASKEHPLIIFLDDMQWTDQASILFIQTMASDLELQYLFFIFAYRDNEVDANHPFIKATDNLRSQSHNIAHIHLSPLGLDSVTELIKDTLYVDQETALPLAKLIKEKTEGNAFFTLELLKSLNRNKLLSYDSKLGRWKWDINKIQQLEISDNVVDLMIKRLTDLPNGVLRTLKIAACVGIRFHASVLSRVLNEDSSVTTTSLRLAMSRGLIHVIGEVYAFHHDRIQQAAYTLISETDRPYIHLLIGKALLEAEPDEVEKNIFQIVNQYNHGTDLIEEAHERKRIADLNLDAGMKSKASNAYITGLNYLMKARALYPQDLWARDYKLAFFLNKELAETAYLAGDLRLAEETFNLVLKHGQSKTDKAQVYYLQIKLYQVAGNFSEAMRISLDAFSQFGLIMPDTPEAANALLMKEMEKAKEFSDKQSPETLLDYPAMKNLEIKALVDLLEASGPPAYMARPELFPVIALKMVNYSFEHGNTETSCYGYGIYGLMLAGVFNQVELGYLFTEVALKLNEKFNDIRLKGSIQHLMGDHVNFWKNHISSDIPILEKGFDDCVLGGDLIYSNYIGFQLPWHIFETGTSLEKVINTTNRFVIFAVKTKYDAVAETIRLEQSFFRHLQGINDFARKDEQLKVILDSNFSCGHVYYHIMELIIHYMDYEYDKAKISAERSLEHISAALSMPIEFSYYFFHALTLTASFADLSEEEKPKAKEVIDSYVKKFETWSTSCSDNFQCRYLILLGELHRLDGKFSEALSHYEQAMESAKIGGFIHIQALAAELSGLSALSMSISYIADHYLTLSYELYSQWGAHGKAAALKNRYPQLELKRPGSVRTSTSSTGQLDFLSIIKASQTISQEIELSSLLQTLMKVVLEHAGATDGFIILNTNGILTIEASASKSGETQKIFQKSVEINQGTTELPLSIVHYVQRSHAMVLLGNALAPNTFSHEPYIGIHKPKSLICLPIIRNKDLVGIIYLENHLVQGTFHESRLSTLELLASQIAISIENSRLYERSQKAISMRDQFLSIASHELRTPLTSLILQIQMRRRKLSQEEVIMSNEALKDWLQKDEYQVLRISRLVNDMLDVSRINSDRLVLNKVEVNLAQLVKDVGERMMEQFKANQQTLTVKACDEIKCLCDSSRIEQVLTNLLTNALKYGDHKPVDVDISKEKHFALIRIQDNGLGIAPQDQERVFRQFERAISVNEISGMGLGLYISRRIIDAHGGKLSVESQLGKGSVFSLRLPLR